MASLVEIENIEEMRRKEGIDDVELRMEIRQLKVGDHVRLTISSGSKFHGTVLVRITEDLVFHAAALTALRDHLAARRGQRFSVTDFKDWTGVSRKYAIPLLEYLDRERMTRRDGDSRIIVA